MTLTGFLLLTSLTRCNFNKLWKYIECIRYWCLCMGSDILRISIPYVYSVFQKLNSEMFINDWKGTEVNVLKKSDKGECIIKNIMRNNILLFVWYQALQGALKFMKLILIKLIKKSYKLRKISEQSNMIRSVNDVSRIMIHKVNKTRNFTPGARQGPGEISQNRGPTSLKASGSPREKL